MTAASDRLDSLYQILSGDDSDERACAAIPDEACTDVPKNYVLNVLNGTCTKLAEQLASPGLVLPWMLSAIGAPAVFATLLTPIKQAGSLLPQMVVASRIRALPRRKFVWAAAGTVQAACLLLIAGAALALPAFWAGAAAVALFALFAIASGAGSIAFQDTTAKTVSKGLRGRMLSNRATAGGALTLASAALFALWLGERESLSVTVPLIAAAALLWLAGAALFAMIEETPGETGGGRSLADEIAKGVDLFRGNGAFRRYVAARVALLGVELALPFYALLAAGILESSVSGLGLMIVAVGIANLVSSPFWGPLADRSSRRVMALAGAMTAAAGAVAVLTSGAVPQDSARWIFAGLIFVIAVAEAGLRLGRKTWLLDGAPPEERPLYVAFSNTAVGVAALFGGLIGLVADFAGAEWGVAITALLAAAGAALAALLPPPEDLAKT